MNLIVSINNKTEKLTSAFTLHHWLLASSTFSCILLLARMIATASIEYIFLPWNLFLAFIPYFIAKRMIANVSLIEHKIKRVFLLASWLLFIPNSFYIITDLYHITHVHTAPKWFDLLLVFSFAWNGLVAGIISVQKIELILKIILNKTFSFITMLCIMWLCGFGIYIGRYLRFNSWDVITNPFSLISEIITLLFYPLQNTLAWSMTGCYAIFMTLVYYTIKKLGDTTKAAA